MNPSDMFVFTNSLDYPDVPLVVVLVATVISLGILKVCKKLF